MRKFVLLALLFCLKQVNAQTTLTVTIVPEDTVHVNPTYCTNVPYHFTGNANPGPIFSYSWTCSPSAGVIIQSPNMDGTAVTFANLGSYTLALVAKNSSGAIDSAKYLIHAPGVLQTPILTTFPSSPTVCNGGTGTTLYAITTPTINLTTYTWSPQNGTLINLNAIGDSVMINPSNLNPSQNFTYSVVGMQNGCVSAPTVMTVTVTAPPTPQYTANPNPICSGAETVLSVNGMPSYTTYTWSQTNNTGGLGSNSGSSVYATPVYNGTLDTSFTYFVSLNLPGCPPYPPNAVVVFVHPEPRVSFILQKDSSAANTWDVYPTYSSYVTTANWNWGDATSISSGLYPSHTYAIAGSYSICVTASYTNNNLTCVGPPVCQNDSLYRLAYNSASNAMVHVNVINQTAGIQQLTANHQQLSVYPNPANGIINIQSNAELGNVAIYNSLGESILQLKSKNVKEQIDLSKFPSGIYIIQTQSKYIKLIKE